MILNTRKSVVQYRVSSEDAAIQQIKAAGVTARGQSTQGLPQTVSNVSIAMTKAGSNRSLRVSFTQNPSDPYFSTAHVYVQHGTAQPTLVASGISPVAVTLPQSKTPAKITVVSSGNWGATSIAKSPSRAVSLA